MGKQTDAHVANVNSELTKLATALTTMETEAKAFSATWSQMMTAYDTKGQAASAKFGPTLKADAIRHDQAVANAKTALAAATKAVTTFDAWVIAKDKSTINPLAKKSIGKSKKFVADAKQELVSPGSVLNGKSLMVNAYNSCVGIYY